VGEGSLPPAFSSITRHHAGGAATAAREEKHMAYLAVTLRAAYISFKHHCLQSLFLLPISNSSLMPSGKEKRRHLACLLPTYQFCRLLGQRGLGSSKRTNAHFLSVCSRPPC